MTRKDYLRYLCTGIAPSTFEHSLTLAPSTVCPEINPHSGTHDVTPSPTRKDFNGMSIKDVQAFHEFKGMDRLHQLDALARMYHRGNALNAVLKTEGSKTFVDKHYSPKS